MVHFLTSIQKFKECLDWTRTKVANLREWSLTSLVQNEPTVQKHFCLSEVKQPLVKFAINWNLSQVIDDVKFWLLRVALRCFSSNVNALLSLTISRLKACQLKKIKYSNFLYCSLLKLCFVVQCNGQLNIKSVLDPYHWQPRTS